MATTLSLAAGRVPPHDLDAELSVLGSILLDPLSIAKVLQFLRPEDFYRENNGQIYRAALDLFAAGEPLLKRAQDAGTVRRDVEFSDVMHMVIGISKIPSADPKQIEHILRIALDGLRYSAES